MRSRVVVLCSIGISFAVAAPLFAANVSCDPSAPNECMGNYTCGADSTCDGEPKNEGQSCQNPTNTCMTDAVCMQGVCTGTKVADNGAPCNIPGLDLCFEEGHCMTTVIPGFSFSFCIPGAMKTCDQPSDPCKQALCNPETGNCEETDRCFTFFGCETCDASTGTCHLANIGLPCADAEGDGNVCTTDDRCTILNIGDQSFLPGSGSHLPFAVQAALADPRQATMRGFCAGVPGGSGAPTATPTATPQSGQPTPTPVGPVLCVGDCDTDFQVTVDEILTMVNIALGLGSITPCTRGDLNMDGQITVDEILVAVNNALNGCPSV